MKRSKLWTCVMIFACPSMLWAQGETKVPDTLRIRLESALEMALSDNPTIKIAEREVQRMDYAKLGVQGGLYPTLSASAQYSRAVEKPVMFLPAGGPFGPGGQMEIGMDNSLMAGISASMPLVAPALWKNLQISKADVEIALEKSRSSKIEMSNQVKKGYYSALLAFNSFEVLKKSYDIAMQNYDNIKTMYEQGMVAEYDLIRADIRVRNMQPSIVQMQQSLEMSNRMMKVLLSVPQDVVLIIEGDLTEYEKVVVGEEVPAYFSLEENTDLLQLEMNLRKMEKQRKLVNTQAMPTLAAFANFQPQTQADDGAKLNWALPFSAGFQLNIPIFKGLSVHYQERQIRVGKEQMEFQMDYLSENLQVQARNSLNSMVTAKEQIESNKLNVKQAEKGLSIAQTRYQTGAGTILELNDSDMALTQAQLNYHQAIYDYLQAKADFEKVLGKY